MQLIGRPSLSVYIVFVLKRSGHPVYEILNHYLNIYSSTQYGAILLLQLSIVIHIAAFLHISFP